MTSQGHLWVDGTVVPYSLATTHLLSHALHYGTSVFEGMRFYGGRPFALEEHNRRLVESALSLDMALPWSVEQLNHATSELIQCSGLQDGYVRTLAWVGPSRIVVGTRGVTPQVSIACWQWPNYFEATDAKAGSRGIRVCLSKWSRPAPHTAPVHCKGAGNYVIGTLARNEAERRGYDDAILLTYDGRLAEATGANLFLAIHGVLHTPRADCFLSGITRKTVIRLAHARGITVVERDISPAELMSAQEVFLTGTAVEVQRVAEVEDYFYEASAITDSLAGDYAREVRCPTTGSTHLGILSSPAASRASISDSAQVQSSQ